VSSTLIPYPQAPIALLDWIQRQFGMELGGPASTEAPLAGTTPLPHVQVYGLGGERERLNDYPAIGIMTFAANYNTAADLAERIDTGLLGYPIVVESNGRTVVLDSVEVNSPPVEVPWDPEGTIRRFQATYSISIRR